MYDMNDIELLTWIETRFGLTKSIGVDPNPNVNHSETVENELVAILQKYKTLLNIESPIPKIKMWTYKDKFHFMFFDKRSDKRVLLGEWLSNKVGHYEH